MQIVDVEKKNKARIMQSRGKGREQSRGGCGMGTGSSWRFVGCSATLEALIAVRHPTNGRIAAWSYSERLGGGDCTWCAAVKTLQKKKLLISLVCLLLPCLETQAAVNRKVPILVANACRQACRHAGRQADAADAQYLQNDWSISVSALLLS